MPKKGSSKELYEEVLEFCVEQLNAKSVGEQVPYTIDRLRKDFDLVIPADTIYNEVKLDVDEKPEMVIDERDIIDENESIVDNHSVYDPEEEKNDAVELFVQNHLVDVNPHIISQNDPLMMYELLSGRPIFLVKKKEVDKPLEPVGKIQLNQLGRIDDKQFEEISSAHMTKMFIEPEKAENMTLDQMRFQAQIDSERAKRAGVDAEEFRYRTPITIAGKARKELDLLTEKMRSLSKGSRSTEFTDMLEKLEELNAGAFSDRDDYIRKLGELLAAATKYQDKKDSGLFSKRGTRKTIPGQQRYDLAVMIKEFAAAAQHGMQEVADSERHGAKKIETDWDSTPRHYNKQQFGNLFEEAKNDNLKKMTVNIGNEKSLEAFLDQVAKNHVRHEMQEMLKADPEAWKKISCASIDERMNEFRESGVMGLLRKSIREKNKVPSVGEVHDFIVKNADRGYAVDHKVYPPEIFGNRYPKAATEKIRKLFARGLKLDDVPEGSRSSMLDLFLKNRFNSSLATMMKKNPEVWKTMAKDDVNEMFTILKKSEIVKDFCNFLNKYNGGRMPELKEAGKLFDALTEYQTISTWITMFDTAKSINRKEEYLNVLSGIKRGINGKDKSFDVRDADTGEVVFTGHYIQTGFPAMDKMMRNLSAKIFDRENEFSANIAPKVEDDGPELY